MMAHFITIYLLHGVIILGGLVVLGEMLSPDEETDMSPSSVLWFLAMLPFWPVQLVLAIRGLLKEVGGR